MNRWQSSLFLAMGLMVGGVMLAGCAEQKAAPAPSQRQVQSDSDRFFDKMKQEERDQGKGPERPSDSGY